MKEIIVERLSKLRNKMKKTFILNTINMVGNVNLNNILKGTYAL